MNYLENMYSTTGKDPSACAILEICKTKLFDLIYMESEEDIRNFSKVITLKCKGINIASLSVSNNIPDHISSGDIAQEVGEQLSRILLNTLLLYGQKNNNPKDIERLDNNLKLIGESKK